MNNPHGVEPTRYMKRKGSNKAIRCCDKHGPIFGDDDICLGNIGRFMQSYGQNAIHSGSICNDGTRGYECHPEYKSSLFVNTYGPNEKNEFRVSDYEVFGIDNYEEYIKHICKHPDIMWECIQTKDISEESLQRFNDDTELLNDLDTIHCKDSKIIVKISQYYLKDPSTFLPDTQIVNQQYDDKLREWLGSEYEYKLLYRASEHEYTAESFHEYCDNAKGPTLIVIKSSRGWIFGGYTTQSWSGSIYYAVI